MTTPKWQDRLDWEQGFIPLQEAARLYKAGIIVPSENFWELMGPHDENVLEATEKFSESRGAWKQIMPASHVQEVKEEYANANCMWIPAPNYKELTDYLLTQTL